MGVSIAHYRQAIGIFNSNCAQSNNKLYCARDLYQKAKFCEGRFDTRNPLDIFLHYIYCIAISYIFMEMYMLSTVPSSKTQEQIFYESDDNFGNYSSAYATNYYLILYNNSMYIILFTHIIKKMSSNARPYKSLISSGLNSMRNFFETSITLYVTSITLLLIVISNCSLLNPRPKNIQPRADSNSVYYQNINGLLLHSVTVFKHFLHKKMHARKSFKQKVILKTRCTVSYTYINYTFKQKVILKTRCTGSYTYIHYTFEQKVILKTRCTGSYTYIHYTFEQKVILKTRCTG